MTTVFNLQSRIDQLSNDIEYLDIKYRKWLPASLIARNFVGITPAIDYDQLDALILRAATIPVILYEGHNGDTYEVLAGHTVLETAMLVAMNQAEFEPRHLVRRVIETEIPVIIFRCNMPRADVIFFAKKFYNIDFV
jgi:hypothetical protein